MKTVVIDYGMSNLGSIRRSLEECGAEVVIASEPKQLQQATHIILPGVGAFPDGMRNLAAGGWIPALQESVLKLGIPILGICLGMQLLAKKGYEGKETAGLGLIRGEVTKMIAGSPDMRIPHIGWNEVHKTKETPLLAQIPNGADFYFVHSYHFVLADEKDCAAKTPYCTDFVSVVQADNIFGTQFHPEKSGRYGLQLLKNFLNFWNTGDK